MATPGVLYRANLDGSFRENLLDSEKLGRLTPPSTSTGRLSGPLALDPEQGKLFVATTTGVLRTDMNGNNIEHLGYYGGIEGLAFDYKQRALYLMLIPSSTG